MSILRAERVDFQIAPGYFLEFYRLPNGEKRVGLSSLAVVCGHKSNYFYRIQSAAPKHLKTLLSMGFTGYTVEVSVGRNNARGASRSLTLSLPDAIRFIEFSAFEIDKKPAQSIARAFLGVTMESIARKAFGEDDLTLEEIRHYICKQFATTLDWMEEDRDDSRMIHEHLLFLQVAQ